MQLAADTRTRSGARSQMELVVPSNSMASLCCCVMGSVMLSEQHCLQKYLGKQNRVSRACCRQCWPLWPHAAAPCSPSLVPVTRVPALVLLGDV